MLLRFSFSGILRYRLYTEGCFECIGGSGVLALVWQGRPTVNLAPPLFVTVANLLETSISNYLLYGILLSIFDFQD